MLRIPQRGPAPSPPRSAGLACNPESIRVCVPGAFHVCSLCSIPFGMWSSPPPFLPFSHLPALTNGDNPCQQHRRGIGTIKGAAFLIKNVSLQAPDGSKIFVDHNTKPTHYEPPGFKSIPKKPRAGFLSIMVLRQCGYLLCTPSPSVPMVWTKRCSVCPNHPWGSNPQQKIDVWCVSIVLTHSMPHGRGSASPFPGFPDIQSPTLAHSLKGP